MNEMNCEKCRFFKKYDYSENWGACHRFPPHIISMQENDATTLFPEVGKKTWCGEFKEIE